LKNINNKMALKFEDVIDLLKKLPRYEHNGKEHIYNKYIINLAKQIGQNHNLARRIWKLDILGAKGLSIYIADSKLVSSEELDRWVKHLNRWEDCDAFCAHFVRNTPFALEKAFKWAEHEKEFEKRAGFSMIAQLAWIKSKIKDEDFIRFLPIIEKHSVDDRYYVKKAVNWALRDIGKRNANLKKHVLKLSQKLQKSENKTSCWVGKYRIKEVENS